jgi:hypothetical protein
VAPARCHPADGPDRDCRRDVPGRRAAAPGRPAARPPRGTRRDGGRLRRRYGHLARGSPGHPRRRAARRRRSAGSAGLPGHPRSPRRSPAVPVTRNGRARGRPGLPAPVSPSLPDGRGSPPGDAPKAPPPPGRPSSRPSPLAAGPGRSGPRRGPTQGSPPPWSTRRRPPPRVWPSPLRSCSMHPSPQGPPPPCRGSSRRRCEDQRDPRWCWRAWALGPAGPRSSAGVPGNRWHTPPERAGGRGRGTAGSRVRSFGAADAVAGPGVQGGRPGLAAGRLQTHPRAPR